MSLTPWNGKPVTIIKADEGSTLTIRQAKEGDNPQYVFETVGENAQLEALFATLAGSNKPVKSSNFVMYGTKKGENGRPQAIMTEHTQPYTDRKTGEEKVGMWAYSPKQLDAFVPLSFVILTKYMNRKGGGKFPAPIFLAHATPFERTRDVQDMGFQRVTVVKTAQADEPKIVRRAAKPVAASKA